jgi:hypothetical protein
MLSQSYARRLHAHSALTRPVTLVAFIALAVPDSASSPLAPSPTYSQTSFQPSARTSSQTPSQTSSLGSHVSSAAHRALPPSIAPADTDSTYDTTVTNRGKIRGGGHVITHDQLDHEQEYPLSSVLVAHFPGIRVVRGDRFNRVASGIHVSIKGDPCFVQLFIDGVFAADGDVDMVNVRDLESIEYRTPGNIPVQFQNRLAGAPCGALLLWSKG